MLDLKCGCNCFGHPKRAHSTLRCKHLKRLMAERGKELMPWGRYEEKGKRR